MIRAFVLVILVGLVLKVEGNTLYVSTSGSDLAQCTFAEPCRSVSRAAGLMVNGEVIHMNSGYYTGSLNTGSVIVSNLNVSVVAFGSTVVDCQGITSGWQFTGGFVSITGVTFQNCVNTQSGGALSFTNTLSVSLSFCSFYNNIAGSGTSTNSYGGAVAVMGSTAGPLLVSDCSFGSNQIVWDNASGFDNPLGGCALYSVANTTLSNSLFVNNSGFAVDGSAVYLSGSTFLNIIVANCSFVNNSAYFYGTGGTGALSVSVGGAANVNVTISDSAFIGNVVQSNGQGAGVYVSSNNYFAFCYIYNSVFLDNLMPSNLGGGTSGSAVAVVSGTLSAYLWMYDCTVSGNTAAQGAIYVSSDATVGQLYLYNVSLINNIALGPNSMAAIFVQGIPANVYMYSCLTVGNELPMGASTIALESQQGNGVYFYTYDSVFVGSTSTPSQSAGYVVYLNGQFIGQGAVVNNCVFANNINTLPLNLGGTSANVSVSVSNSVFTNNGGGIVAAASHTGCSMTVTNSTFDNNVGTAGTLSVFADTQVTVTLNNCTFTNNMVYSAGGGAVFAIVGESQLTVSIANCEFWGNIAYSGPSQVAVSPGGGGAVSVFAPVGNAYLTLTSCNFNNNAAVIVPGTYPGSVWTGGAVFYNGATQFISLDCSFNNNTASQPGSGIYMSMISLTQMFVVNMQEFSVTNHTGSTAFVVTIGTGCPIQYGYCIDNGVAYFLLASGVFSGNSVSNIDSNVKGGALSITVAFSTQTVNVQLMNLLFADNVVQQGLGSALYLAGIYTSATVSDCTFNNNGGYGLDISGGAIYVDTNAQLTMNNANFNNNMAYYGGALYLAGTLQITSDVSFTGNQGFSKGGAIYVLSSESFALSGTTFANNTAYSGAAVYLGQLLGASASIASSLFASNKAQISGAAIYCSISCQVTATDTSFIGNAATETGGALLANGQVTVQSCQFSGNTAVSGGAAYVQSAVLELTDVNLNQNSAGGEGGAVYVDGASNFFATQAVFTQSVAAYGSAVYIASGGSVSMNETQFITNYAQAAGGAVFWSGIGDQFECFGCVYVNNTALYGLNNATSPVLVVAGSVSQSPDNAYNISAYTVDYYGQIVLHPQGLFTIVPVSALGTCIGGASPAPIVDGYAQFVVTLSAPQGTSTAISFSASEPNILPSSAITVTLSACSVGRTQAVGGDGCTQCIDCDSGFYNVNGNGICQPCQPGEQCLGGTNVASESNSWLWYNTTSGVLIPYECLPNLCAAGDPLAQPATKYRTSLEEGSIPRWFEGNNNCTYPSTGFMCAQCVAHHSVWGGQCADCSEGPKYGLLVLILLGNWVYVLVVHILLSGSNSSALTLTLIDFYQTIQLVIPSQFFDLTSTFASLLNSNLPSAGVCLYSRTYFGQFIQRFVLAAISYSQLLVIVALVMLYSKLFSAQPLSRSRWVARPLLSLTLSLYTPITEVALGMIRYQQIGDYTVLRQSPSLWALDSQGSISPTYFPYFICSIVALFVVTFGVPMALVSTLIRFYRRNEWDQVHIESKFGALYAAFRPSYRWWLVCMIARRTLFAALLAIPDVANRSLIVVFVSLGLLTLQLQSAPCQNMLDNIGGALSLISIAMVATASSGFVMNLSQTSFESLHILIDVLQIGSLAAIAVLLIISMRDTIRGVFQVVIAMSEYIRWKISGGYRPHMNTSSAIDKNPLLGKDFDESL